MILCIALTVILLILGFAEVGKHKKNLNRVPIRILVNGTRGKTTTARLLVASLNANGIRTLGRTTGSEAQRIFPDGHIEPFARKRNASILEMKSLFRTAVDNKVEAVVVECMALRPENQRTIAKTLVNPTHVIITNTYVDHIPEMGGTIEETAYAMGLSVPEGSQLFTTEDHYSKLNAVIHKVEGSETAIEGSIPIHGTDYALVKAVVENLKLDPLKIESAAMTIAPDIGLHESFKGRNEAILIPTFSVNDLTCMEQTVSKVLSEHVGKNIWLVFNNRADREYRILLMDKVIEHCKDRISGVYCIGDYTWKVSRHFARHGIKVYRSSGKELFDLVNEASEKNVFVGLGNIKGQGEELVGRFLKEVE